MNTVHPVYPHNFSPGPGAIPASVLERAVEAMRLVPEMGLPILGIGHRTAWFRAVVEEAEALVGSLLGLKGGHRVLFLQGGASLQFTQIPMSFLGGGDGSADYLQTGYWSSKAVAEGRRQGRANVVWSGEAAGYTRLPTAGELQFNPNAAYFHYVSSETVEGLQFADMPGLPGVPRCCDMSSDFLSRQIDAAQFGMIYAHAQKNLGPSGVTIVILRDDLLRAVPAGLPPVLDYRVQADAHSIYNTPPVFAIYVVLLVLRWLRDDIGGVAAMERINRAKAAALHAALDAGAGFYRQHAERGSRSIMNATFALPTPALQQRLVEEAAAEGITGLEGHRAIGGLRASLYNAVSLESTQVLAGFLRAFYQRCG